MVYYTYIRLTHTVRQNDKRKQNRKWKENWETLNKEERDGYRDMSHTDDPEMTSEERTEDAMRYAWFDTNGEEKNSVSNVKNDLKRWKCIRPERWNAASANQKSQQTLRFKLETMLLDSDCLKTDGLDHLVTW